MTMTTIDARNELVRAYAPDLVAWANDNGFDAKRTRSVVVNHETETIRVERYLVDDQGIVQVDPVRRDRPATEFSTVPLTTPLPDHLQRIFQ